jgi:hypothetical protein
MGLANEISNLVTELNRGKNVGTIQFLAGVTSNQCGYGNWAKAFYDTHYIPNLNYFRKEIPLKPKLLRDNPRRINKRLMIENTERVGESFNVSGYISWDSFLDDGRIMNFDFAKEKPSHGLKPGHFGIVVLEDPLTNKYRSSKDSLIAVLKKSNDLASILLNMIGVCPRMNPFLRRLAGFEIGKQLRQNGLNIIQDGNYIVMETPAVTSGFFGNIIKKAVKAMKSAGSKIQKSLLDPIREWMKSKVPAVWNVVDKFDKGSGFTKTLKKFSKGVEGIALKYGEKVLSMAIMATATVVGGPGASVAAGMLLKVADNLSNKDKKVLTQIVDAAGQVEKVDKTDMKDLTVNLFSSLKDQMITSTGKEGEVDFDMIMNMAKEAVVKTEKSKEEAKTVVSGVGIGIMPLTQYSSFISGVILKAIK